MQEHCVSTSEIQRCSGNGLLSIDWKSGHQQLHSAEVQDSLDDWSVEKLFGLPV
jgi:hypothetical protein